MKRVADDGEELPVETYNPDDVSTSENTAPKKENKSPSRKGSKDSLKGSKDKLTNSRGSNKSLKVALGDKTSNDLIDKPSESELKSALRDPQHRGLKKGLSVSFRGSSVEKLGVEAKADGEGKVCAKEKVNKKKTGKKSQKNIANKTGQKLVALFKKKKKTKDVAEDKPAEAEVKVDVEGSSKRDELKRSKPSKKESKSAKKETKEKKSKAKKK